MREAPLSEATRIYVLGFGPANNPAEPTEIRAGSAGEAHRLWTQLPAVRLLNPRWAGATCWVQVKSTGEVVIIDRANLTQCDPVAP